MTMVPIQTSYFIKIKMMEMMGWMIAMMCHTMMMMTTICFMKNNDDDEYDYLSMQAQFDNVDLPTDVEATVSWLNEPASSSKVFSKVRSLSHLVGSQTSTPTNYEHASSGFLQVPASSSTLVSGGSNSREKEETSEDEETNDNWH
ncbi:hypothetical protein T459_19276 [Capsicum annuum]|uniref:Uncharacterized protein n=1 Tax=Capsicum annuum TaxID=4072 RepID=A0A2G2Z1C4_CAPAN|nr:hypothetical protein T459_19276 [Capsicum annuum]